MSAQKRSLRLLEPVFQRWKGCAPDRPGVARGPGRQAHALRTSAGGCADRLFQSRSNRDRHLDTMAHFPCHGRLKYVSELVVHKVAMKLGKPLALGRFEDAVFIGLPGNPLAALAGAIGFLLARMGGAAALTPADARAGFKCAGSRAAPSSFRSACASEMPASGRYAPGWTAPRKAGGTCISVGLRGSPRGGYGHPPRQPPVRIPVPAKRHRARRAIPECIRSNS
jgi:hypothetical protein